MRRYFFPSLTILVLLSVVGLYFFNRYWIQRFDDLIARHATVYRVDSKLVWSVIYEETYFRPWQIGAADEVGLMQVTPTVAREWAKETGFREFEKQTAENVVEFLRRPERNIQIGCWYLENLREKYRGFPAEEAMTLAAYNAGASRVSEWSESNEQAHRSSYLKLIAPLATVELAEEVAILAEGYISRGIFHRKFIADALHVALASFHKIDYLVTWNFGHLANVRRQARIRLFNTAAGFFSPVIITPEFLVHS